jgi:hypothetical protein
MCAWIKFFSDGTTEVATEASLSSGKSSWTKGRLENIKEVQLITKTIVASLSVSNTNWYQFNRHIALMQEGKVSSPSLFSVVQAEIKEDHINKYIVSKNIGNCFFYTILNDHFCKDFVKISNEDIGKWITLILPKFKKPYIVLCDKGKYK